MPKHKVKMHKNDDLHAVMGVDPGGTTGVAACYVELGVTMKETMPKAYKRKAIEVSGDWLQQSIEIARVMNAFQFTANVEHEIPLYNIHFAFEDFVLRRKREGGATGNLTSCWVGAGAVAIFGNEDGVRWRQASMAKTFATDDRLKMWDLWEVGSAHKRDAWRHVASEVNAQIG